MSAEWIKTAKVGDKVQCVRTDDNIPGDLILIDVPETPHVGKAYTIRAICRGVFNNICFKLEEIPDQSIEVEWRGKICFGDVMFPANNFRPIRPTDISIFTGMLKTTPTPVWENA